MAVPPKLSHAEYWYLLYQPFWRPVLFNIIKHYLFKIKVAEVKEN